MPRHALCATASLTPPRRQYLVNLLLASRFLQVSARLSLCMSVAALAVYVGCLGLNWGYQVLFLTRLWRTKPSISSKLPPL